MKELLEKIEELRTKSQEIGKILNVEERKKKIIELEKDSNAQDFWNDPQKAGKVMQELEELKKETDGITEIEQKITDLGEMMKIIEEEKDKEEIEREIGELEKIVNELEFKTLFSGQYDRNDAILSIYSGAGGVDAQDWAEMLLRMYLRFAERSGFRAKIASETRGQEAGIKNAGWKYPVHMPTVISRVRLACIVWCGFLRLIPTTCVRLLLLWRKSCRSSPISPKWRSNRRICASMSIAQAAPAAKVSTLPIAPCVSHTFLPAWSSHARTNAASYKTRRLP